MLQDENRHLSASLNQLKANTKRNTVSASYLSVIVHSYHL